MFYCDFKITYTIKSPHFIFFGRITETTKLTLQMKSGKPVLEIDPFPVGTDSGLPFITSSKRRQAMEGVIFFES